MRSATAGHSLPEKIRSSSLLLPPGRQTRMRRCASRLRESQMLSSGSTPSRLTHRTDPSIIVTVWRLASAPARRPWDRLRLTVPARSPSAPSATRPFAIRPSPSLQTAQAKQEREVREPFWRSVRLESSLLGSWARNAIVYKKPGSNKPRSRPVPLASQPPLPCDQVLKGNVFAIEDAIRKAYSARLPTMAIKWSPGRACPPTG